MLNLIKLLYNHLNIVITNIILKLIIKSFLFIACKYCFKAINKVIHQRILSITYLHNTFQNFSSSKKLQKSLERVQKINLY